MTTSSNAALPARSPIPLIVHSTCRAPPSMPARVLATASPRSLWQCTENMALSELGTRSRTVLNKARYSSGTVYPTVSGRLMVVAPALMAASTQRHRKSISVRVPSSADHSTLATRLRARATDWLTRSSTFSGSICNLYFICTGDVEINV